jgi:hypothetical protein
VRPCCDPILLTMYTPEYIGFKQRSRMHKKACRSVYLVLAAIAPFVKHLT